MARSLGFAAAVTFLALSGAAISQVAVTTTPSGVPLTTTPNLIASIPPVARAVLTGDPKEVGKSLEDRGNVNEPVRAKEGGKAGFTPLILAAALSRLEIVKMLVERGANVTALDDFHRSAFWYAALRDDVPVAGALSSADGASKVINEADYDLQRTPLHLAVRGDDPQLVLLLLKLGASREHKDVLGQTPLDYCKRNFTGACKALL